jgi:hypothetical protein
MNDNQRAVVFIALNRRAAIFDGTTEIEFVIQQNAKVLLGRWGQLDL